MSRKNRKKRVSSYYWQSANYNEMMYQSFRMQIINLALSRFKWINLPATCDARFLEWTLLNNGVATIAAPTKTPNTFYSTQAAALGPWNVYDNPTQWESFGNNGWRFKVTPANGVLIYENLSRQPLMPILDLYARELTDVMLTKKMNRQHQKIPFILVGSQDQKLDMLNLYKQVDGGEPAIITTNGINSIEFKALETGVKYIGSDLQSEFLNIWSLVYTALGIENQPFLKKERQITEEVETATMPSNMMAQSPLDARRYECEKLNTRFEPFITNPIYPVWNQDVISDNYNFVNNLASDL